MTKIIKLKEHDSRRETGTIELTNDGFVEFTVEEIGYYGDGAWYRLTNGEKSQLLNMIAPELLAENEKLKNRLKATQFLLEEAKDKLGREVTITSQNAIYVDGTRITHRGTKWGVHHTVESFIVHDRAEVYQRVIDAGFERAARNIDTHGFGGGDFLPKMEDE